jgi:N-hydroxyarylamine O-acetyltransferase
MDEVAYLNRIGLPDAGKPDAELLRELHLRHLRTVPFENLSIHLGEPITLEVDALVDKLVGRRRGGFCYELNGSFAALLDALGFAVTMHACRVHVGEGKLSIPFDHMALIVRLDEPWIADVGFGRHAHHPLRLEFSVDQPDPDGVYRLEQAPDGDIDVLRDGELQYRLESRERSLDQFQMGAWWNSTSPKSHFTQNVACSLTTENGRITLSGNRLITTVDGERTETSLEDDAAILGAYRELFGVELARVPTVKG